MSTTQNLKFIHLGSNVAATNNTANAGAIIFEPKSGRIAVQGTSKLEYYGGGRIADAKFDENRKLTLSFNDGSDPIVLDFSDTASASGVDKILGKLRYDVDALKATVNGTDKDGSHTPGLVDKVKTNTTDIAANTAAIAVINDKSTGILAQAKAYTNGKVGDIGDGNVKDYVDTAKGAAIEAAKTYADATFDKKGSAAQALADAKAYTDTATNALGGRVGTLETSVDALKTKVGDENSGLVKKVNDNANAITALQGLHKDKTGGKMSVEEEVTAGVNAKVGDIKIDNKAVTVKEYVDAGDAKALNDAKSYTNTKVETINSNAEALKDRVDTLEGTVSEHGTKLNTLIGTDADKSVRSISAEEVAKVVAGAPASYDTLKEIADWIANDTTGAASMANDIATLKTAVGKKAEGDKPATGLYKDIADNKSAINVNAGAIDALEALHAPGKNVAQEVTDGINKIAEASVTSDDGTDVKVTVKTAAGSVSDVIVDASVLRGAVDDNAEAIAAETVRATGVEGDLKTSLNAVSGALGEKADVSTKDTAFGRIKALEEKQADGALMWSVWD